MTQPANEQTDLQAAITEAATRLEELETEIAALPARIRQVERTARQATDVTAVEKYLADKDELEKRHRALPYLIPNARRAVLTAKAALAKSNRDAATAETPAAQAELAEATAALDAAQKRFRDADARFKRLQAREAGQSVAYQKLTDDAEAIAQGRPTNHYFTATT